MGQQIETEVYHNLLTVQEQDHQQLKAKAAESETEWTPPLTKLAEQVIAHYESYYRVESKLIMENVRVLLVLSPEWPSHLEDTFLWVGGWRPSVTFHLLDFKPESHLGAGLGELIKGLSMCELKDITPSQLARVDKLMRQTIREETELTQSLIDAVEIESCSSGGDVATSTWQPIGQIMALADTFGKAYDLRVRTLRSLVRILSPIQAVQFFIPVAELHLKVQEWSKNKENATHGVGLDGGPEPFGEFFERRIYEQEQDLKELTIVAKTESSDESTRCCRQLVSRVMCHYMNYYRVKSKSVRHNVLNMLTAAWMTPLEHAFIWIGGWRPTTAFHLLFSIVGLQLEARLDELLNGGLTAADLGNLSPSQLIRVDELQTQTIREERELTEALANLQETIADSSMVELSHIATELTRAGCESAAKERVRAKLGIKEDKLKEVFWKADNLRLRTLKNVVNILSPIQAVQFLIGAAELHLRLHDWGT